MTLQVELWGVWAIEDGHGAFDGEPAPLAVEDEQGGARVAAQVFRAGSCLGAGAPELTVDDRDADADGVGRAVPAEGGHGGAVVLVEKRSNLLVHGV